MLQNIKPHETPRRPDAGEAEGVADYPEPTSMTPDALRCICRFLMVRACQESCVEGRLQLNPLLCGEPFAEHDGELRLGGGPFAWRHLPLAADLAQHQEQQLGCRFVIGEVATAAHCGA
jgi:hypothetical protein